MAGTANLSTRKTEKLLTKSIKQVLSDSNINASTRSGNKELGILVKRVASAPFDSAAEVEKLGSALGQKIAGLSQQASKTDLDAGTIRTLSLKKDWMSEFDIPETTPKEKVSKKASKSEQTVVVPAKKTPDVPQPDAAPEPEAAQAEVEEVAMTEVVSDSLETPSDGSIEVSAESSDEPAEVAVPEEASEASEAAEAEEIEAVAENLGGGVSTTTAADAESVAAANDIATEEVATGEAVDEEKWR
ncbi:MAG: hypothetical protein AAGN15_12765 [Cyanobacteria bacterium J06581_3]